MIITNPLYNGQTQARAALIRIQPLERLTQQLKFGYRKTIAIVLHKDRSSIGIDPYPGVGVVIIVKAVFNQVIKQAWKTDPGSLPKQEGLQG